MHISRDYIMSLFSTQDYSRGIDYYRNGRVEYARTEVTDEGLTYKCFVRGARRYRVTIRFAETESGLSAHMECTCPRFADRGVCKHLAAAMLKCADENELEEDDPDEPLSRLLGIIFNEHAVRMESISRPQPSVYSGTDPRAKRLIELYLDKSTPPALGPQARLVPRLGLDTGWGRYPELYLSVGIERMYVVKDIRTFLENVEERRTVSYGKNLTLFHGIENFDDRSRELIELLMDEFRQFRVTSGRFIQLEPKSDHITLDGRAFDRLFDWLLKSPDGVEVRDGGYLTLVEGDPPVKVSLASGGKSVTLTVSAEQTYFFGSRTGLYALRNGQLMRCGSGFREWVFPLISESSGTMRISMEDMPVFCGGILPRLRGLADIDDPEGLLERFLPDECVPRFSFDLDRDGGELTMDLAFRYGETVIPGSGTNARFPDIKRDVMTERQTRDFVAGFFPGGPERGLYRMTGDDAVYDFLTGGMDAFFERGEVFISDRLRGKRLQPSPAGVGISVSDGSLILDIDTGEFPAGELEELYQSLLLKRRYHRLRDGRYLTLDGSPYETLAEMAHMLRLTEKELRQDHVELPAYRGLYLDGVLSEREDMRVSRDSRFRAMVREFKSVAESDYTAPPSLEKILRPYQRLGFQWLKTLESCGFGGILADEMGLGKTVQMIAFFATAARKQTGLSNLVVCPASLILNWTDELAKFAPELAVTAVMGSAADRARLLDTGGEADVLVTSYELLRQDIDRYEKLTFYCCVLDEGQHIKNSSTLASRAVKRLRCRQRFILTGTPIENRLSELWNLFDFLMPGYLYSHSVFVEKLEKPAVKSGDPQAMERLRRLVQPFMLRRLKSDVLRELPPVIEHVRRVPLSRQERRVYLAAAANIRKTLEGESGKLQILAALTRLRQICCDPALCFENYTGETGKLEACLELCAGMTENGHQILLFSQFTSMLDIIRPRLEGMGISSFTLQGSTPKEERARLVRRFNAGEAQVFLISLKAGGTGLNLTAADVVIHYDPWWNLAAQDQATGRAHRIGQRSSVQVYKLIAQDTIEERIMDLQEKKSRLMDAVSSDASGDIMTMSKSDLLALLD